MSNICDLKTSNEYHIPHHHLKKLVNFSFKTDLKMALRLIETLIFNEKLSF